MRRFIRQSWLEFKGQRAAFNLEEFLLVDTLYPLMTMIFYCVMAGYAFHTQNLTRWVVGNAFLLCTSTCVFSLGSSFMGERYYGRIRSIITSPILKMEVVLEKGFFPCLVCVVTTIVGFGVGSMIFHVSWKGVNLLVLLGIIAVAMVSAAAFGMLLSTIGLISDQMHLILNLVSCLLAIFCGANFPISQLPMAGQLFSQCLPLTRSIHAAGLFMEGASFSEYALYLLGELGIAVVYVVLAYGMIQYAQRKAIKKGTLELF